MEFANKKVKTRTVCEIEAESSEIEVEAAEASSLSETTALKKRAAKTRDIQYARMINDMDGKDKLTDDEWDQLTLHLNSIGPPCHTKPKWKKVWKDYQRNQLNKSSMKTQATDNEEELLQQAGSNISMTSTTLEEENDSADKSLEIVKRLDLLIEQHKRHNDLFESLINLIKENFLVVNLP